MPLYRDLVSRPKYRLPRTMFLKATKVLNLEHYLDALSRKPGAFAGSKPLELQSCRNALTDCHVGGDQRRTGTPNCPLNSAIAARHPIGRWPGALLL
jgi:hypothetical protein